MHQFIKDIILSKKTSSKKKEELNKLTEDIELARDIINEVYTYCEECDDYYLTKSFTPVAEEKEENVCVYEDPINSGGNDYEWHKLLYHYSVCPKNHKKVIFKLDKGRIK